MKMDARIMRSRLVCVAAALALAGCGASAGAHPTRKPPVPFPDLGYRYIAPRLPRGAGANTVFVVDLSNVGFTHPTGMRLDPHAVLSGASWSDWGAAHATGRGQATVRICSPSCGGGHDARYPATVVLSSVKTCSGHRFYESGTMTLTTADGPRRFDVSVRKPC
jgi:hypothetical protein